VFAGPDRVAKLDNTVVIAPRRRCGTAMAAAMRSCKDPSGEGWMGKLGSLVGYVENLSTVYAYIRRKMCPVCWMDNRRPKASDVPRG
jgi:hypothetical protein